MVAKGVTIRTSILRWYRKVGRALPWRETTDPYAIAVSETMLQQTQVSRVYPKYLAWLKEFPTTKALAVASTQSILKAWSGLGYNSRALRLRAMAQEIERRGQWPTTKDELQELPGFGPYTAGAVSIFAFTTQAFAIDTNIRRVVTRIFYGSKKAPTEHQLEHLAASLAQTKKNDAWHHAMMDLGAMVCVSGRPRCVDCPVRSSCAAYPAILNHVPKRKRAGTAVRFIDTDRFWRGRIIAILIETRSISNNELTQKLSHFGSLESTRLKKILESMEADGLVIVQRSRISLSQ